MTNSKYQDPRKRRQIRGRVQHPKVPRNIDEKKPPRPHDEPSESLFEAFKRGQEAKLVGLDEFASTLIGLESTSQQPFAPEATPPGLDSTQAFKDLFRLIGNEGRTRAVLSAVLWQVVALSDVFRKLLAQKSIDDPLLKGGRMIVVMHNPSQKRHDLLILSPQYNDKPVSLSLSQVVREFGPEHNFADDFSSWKKKRYAELNESRPDDPLISDTDQAQRSLLDAITSRSNSNFVEELTLVQPFSIVFAPMPTTIYTHIVRSPAWGIALPDRSPRSTAGVATTDRQGRFGVSAALHSVVPDPNSLYDMFNHQGAACVLDKQVYVNNRPGIICSADLITDSCFIELSSNSGLNADQTQGPLRTRSPYQAEAGMFDGLMSHRKDAFVQGVDISIPFVGRGEQAKVYTNAVTNPGDSGAALVNRDGYVVGFSHRRTALGAPIEFAEWIWADSVYNALKLSSTLSVLTPAPVEVS